MNASSITRSTLTYANVRRWAWWQLPALIRAYVGAVVLAGLGFTIYAATQTTWHAGDGWKFALLLASALVSVAATPRSTYQQGAITRDFITVWVVPLAILLPPVYAMVAPAPLYILTILRVHRGAIHRKMFTAAAIALAYGGASLVFRAFPESFAGSTLGTGTHALTWVLAASACEQVGRRGHQVFIIGAIKLTDPTVRLARTEWSREALVADFAEFDLGVMITIVVAVNSVLALFAVPTVLLARRFMMHSQLLAQTRIDTKTGLLNAATWEREAATEVAHAVRVRAPLAVALADIDHFKQVNDTYGHLVGDRVLRALADALRSQLRAYDLAGRFGGEEFIILLPQARESDARSVAERLRTYVASLEIPVDDEPDCMTFVRLTISVGVAALEGENRELTDLMAAADAALYYAKETGRNRTHVISSPPV